MTMEVTAPLGELEAPSRNRQKCPRALFYWSLIIMVTMAQVLAASCLSFYFLRKQQQPDATPNTEKCITHWAAASKQRQGENQALAWETTMGDVRTGNCTWYNENKNSLEIQSPGDYFIYIQVMLSDKWKNVTFSVDERKTYHTPSSAGSSNTLYFGTTCKVRAGAAISVILNPDHVLNGETETFLILFKL
ncbi:hypothetical protein scyTo_0013306 [Scyliorhinus torazame]|uniref:THD domain-containing protein n=1 Tax=Scyliorhinus torazame TaxID=75743 RepID=A0A401NTQ4_SCYTO|nr:hypothetical protein [Scyliorhinus torazame]